MKEQHIFAEHIEQGALDQFASAMACDFVVKGALMPDAHQGYSLPIGAAVATKDFIVPAWVGYDIGCGMCATKTNLSKEFVQKNSQAIFDTIYKNVPVGFARHEKSTSDIEPTGGVTDDLKRIFKERQGDRQLGTLGGGNHFIEIGYGRDDAVWIIVHSGSRGFGWLVAKYYMTLAGGTGKAVEGHDGFHVDSDNGISYLKDLNYCLGYALENRSMIIREVIESINEATEVACTTVGKFINRNHNHATFRDGMWIHRKGATHAEDGMLGVIPGNMRDGSFIVRGKGNPDALWSSSHGAGRVLGRKAAKREINVQDFKDTMIGITAKVGESTVDESPFAYKNIFEVMEQQTDLVEVLDHITPLINIKG